MTVLVVALLLHTLTWPSAARITEILNVKTRVWEQRLYRTHEDCVDDHARFRATHRVPQDYLVTACALAWLPWEAHSTMRGAP